MLTLPTAAIAAALSLFVLLGLTARRRHQALDDYVTARDSQGAIALGLSFLASGMGAWILFAPPEIGALVGPIAVAGYALGSALPFIIIGLIGPSIRQRMPAGRSLTEFAAQRFGDGFRRWISLLSVLYMLCFLAAELTAIGAITNLLSNVNGSLAIMAVAISTLIYTAIGGLRASLVTDRWQALLMIGLIALVASAALGLAPSAKLTNPIAQSAPAEPISALGVALTLIIAVTSANLFHQGYWQRLWAARNQQALQFGALIGGASTVVVVTLLGLAGLLAAARGLDLGAPPIPFFALINQAPAWITLPALILAITLVASSIDTLQNALVSLGVTETGRLGLRGARWLTALLMVPVIALALQQVSVLRLFLIADLLCASAVIPLLSGLSSRVSRRVAIAGALAGLLGAVLPSVVLTGDVLGGLQAASFPGGVPTLTPFLGALLASGLVTGVGALGAKPSPPRSTPR